MKEMQYPAGVVDKLSVLSADFYRFGTFIV